VTFAGVTFETLLAAVDQAERQAAILLQQMAERSEVGSSVDEVERAHRKLSEIGEDFRREIKALRRGR